MFVHPNAQDVVVHGSQTTDIISELNLSGIDILLAASCPQVLPDSSDRVYSPRCLPGTRKQYIKDFMHWAIPIKHDTPLPLYRMKGPAGTGKSAIAQTCAEKLKKLEKLGAAFFFSINGDRPEKLFPSIAYQLSTVHTAYHDLIEAKIRHDNTLVSKPMASQFQYLIEEPLRELEAQGKGIRKRMVVIIDGLDECEGTETQCEIIRIIGAAAIAGSALPLCWAFFSRPKPHIEATFSETTIAQHCHKAVLPMSSDADVEIMLYLRNGFDDIIRPQNQNTSISRWPSADDIRIIVDAANGSFMYARTVLRFVGQLDKIGPQKRLRIIIDFILRRRKCDPHASDDIGSPFAELDAFYTSTLRHIPTDIFPSVHLLLAFLCKASNQPRSAIVTANVLKLSKNELETVCNHASDVVHILDPGKALELDPTVDTSCTYTKTSTDVVKKTFQMVINHLGGTVSFHHRSFEDFLLDPVRSGDYCVKGSQAKAKPFGRLCLENSRNYCWEGSELVLPPVSSLSYPYSNKLVNSVINACIYGTTVGPGDFRNHLYLSTHFRSVTGRVFTQVGPVWDCEFRTKAYPGHLLRLVSDSEFSKLSLEKLKLEPREKRYIQSYHPNWSSWVKSLFHTYVRGSVESALYRKGYGEQSVFWYWEINHKLQYYRNLHTTNLDEGMKIFQEENFDSWPECKSNPEWAVKRGWKIIRAL